MWDRVLSPTLFCTNACFSASSSAAEVRLVRRPSACTFSTSSLVGFFVCAIPRLPRDGVNPYLFLPPPGVLDFPTAADSEIVLGFAGALRVVVAGLRGVGFALAFLVTLYLPLAETSNGSASSIVSFSS